MGKKNRLKKEQKSVDKVFFDELAGNPNRLEVTMKNWSVMANPFQAPEVQVTFLQGNAFGHPRFEEGSPVNTSRITGVTDHGEYKIVHTQNTDYRVTAADVDPDYEKLYPGAYSRLSIKKGV